MSLPVRVAAHAKINLFLRILAREADGYHNIETLFCLISLADELVVEAAAPGVLEIDTAGPDVGPAEKNLAVRAARMVLEATGNRIGARIGLTKRIPIQSGLGGGSSDAAAALTAVNQLAGNAIPHHELVQFGARLGSDVPFFLSHSALALAWGHGERLMRLAPLPEAPALLLVPAMGVSTVEAYRWIAASRRPGDRRGAVAMDADALNSWGSIGRMAGNDFESVVFGQLPALRTAFEALASTHPLVCRMTGSGSSLFAVYRNAGDREDARMRLGRKHGTSIPVETLATSP
ncbi:MAG: 4-(cytidine 5'-diphospho)-2-C-methyl-D-erythritol kinase [Gemmatimonadota bacterium]